MTVVILTPICCPLLDNTLTWVVSGTTMLLQSFINCTEASIVYLHRAIHRDRQTISKIKPTQFWFQISLQLKIRSNHGNVVFVLLAYSVKIVQNRKKNIYIYISNFRILTSQPWYQWRHMSFYRKKETTAWPNQLPEHRLGQSNRSDWLTILMSW